MNILSKILLKISSLLRRLARRISNDKEWLDLLKKWQRLDKEKQYRTNYQELNSDSVVFDLGGYQGQWASDVYAQYLCKIYLFEPHPEYVLKIKERFLKNKNIKVYDFGLGKKDEKLMLGTDEESSSIYSKGKNMVEMRLVEAEKFLTAESIEWIDLMKINIEGGEYELLDHMINTGRVKKIKNIQIQFHHFVPDAIRLMDDLHKRLAMTHETTYMYKFFWENWRLKK